MIKLIALDTDGTLLNSKNKILPSTKAAIKKSFRSGNQGRTLLWSTNRGSCAFHERTWN